MEDQSAELMNKIMEARRKTKVEDQTIGIFNDQIAKIDKKLKEMQSERDLAQEFLDKSEMKVKFFIYLFF